MHDKFTKAEKISFSVAWVVFTVIGIYFKLK